MTAHSLAHAASRPAERARLAERALWRRHGLEPVERNLQLVTPSVRLRVLEVGSGDPLVLVHGTVGPGSWPSLIEAMPNHRYLVVDRPGWGGSDAVEYTGNGYHRLAADILSGALDALGIDRVTVVGASIGDVWALSLAQLAPSRVDRVVMLGGGPLVPEVERPAFVAKVASPLGALLVRLPMGRDRLRAILRENGHGRSLDSGLIPEAFVAWRIAANNHTPAMRHERSMIRAVVAGSGWSPGLLFGDSELRSIATPTLLVHGTADPVGNAALWRQFIEKLPNGSLEVVEGAGHQPWFDEPGRVAAVVERFLET